MTSQVLNKKTQQSEDFSSNWFSILKNGSWGSKEPTFSLNSMKLRLKLIPDCKAHYKAQKMPSKLLILIKVQSVVNNYDEKHAHLLQLAPQIIVYGETVSSIL